MVFSLNMGHAVVQLVEALHYKLEGHGCEFQWGHWIFHCFNPSGHPGVNLASSRKEYQEYLPGGGGVKAASA